MRQKQIKENKKHRTFCAPQHKTIDKPHACATHSRSISAGRTCIMDVADVAVNVGWWHRYFPFVALTCCSERLPSVIMSGGSLRLSCWARRGIASLAALTARSSARRKQSCRISKSDLLFYCFVLVFLFFAKLHYRFFLILVQWFWYIGRKVTAHCS